MFSIALLKIVATFHFQVAGAATSEQYYRIKIPVTNQSCNQEALKLASRFQNISGKAPIESKCSGYSKLINGQFEQQLYVLDLRYQSKDSLTDKIHSSYYGNSFFNDYKNNLHGMFPTLKKCLEQLQARTIEFAKYSGKAVLSSTCEQATSDVEQSYVVRIDTIGIPEVHLFATPDLPESYSKAPFDKAIEKIILANDGHIVAHTGGHFYYYSKELLQPRFWEFGSMREMECHQQLGELNRILGQLRQEELTIGCSNVLQPKGLTRLQAVWNQYHDIFSYATEERYSDFNECDRDKSRKLAQKSAEGFKIQYALCRTKAYNENDYYLMDLY